jgi:hypothetical protein
MVSFCIRNIPWPRMTHIFYFVDRRLNQSPVAALDVRSMTSPIQSVVEVDVIVHTILRSQSNSANAKFQYQI